MRSIVLLDILIKLEFLVNKIKVFTIGYVITLHKLNVNSFHFKLETYYLLPIFLYYNYFITLRLTPKRRAK